MKMWDSGERTTDVYYRHTPSHSFIATVETKTYLHGELNTLTKDCPFKELWRLNMCDS